MEADWSAATHEGLERVRAGRVAWEASVVDVQGVEHSVLLGADGAVLDLRKAD